MHSFVSDCSSLKIVICITAEPEGVFFVLLLFLKVNLFIFSKDARIIVYKLPPKSYFIDTCQEWHSCHEYMQKSPWPCLPEVYDDVLPWKAERSLQVLSKQVHLTFDEKVQGGKQAGEVKDVSCLAFM